MVKVELKDWINILRRDEHRSAGKLPVNTSRTAYLADKTGNRVFKPGESIEQTAQKVLEQTGDVHELTERLSNDYIKPQP